MRVYNTLTRQIEEFVPLESGHVRMYTCGPTVYNFAHVGNFRAYTFEDLLRRYLKFCGFRVTQVMNITDVDDKTIRGAREKGVTLAEFTAPFVKAFFEDLRTLNIEPAEHYPAATAHVPEMIALISRLLKAGFAYQTEDGSVYFNISRFPQYGRLAHLERADLRAGARVAHDEYDKVNACDFALWKAWEPADGDVVWEAPWGRGRPGWHVECSAMSMKYLGETFDLHTGGVDNIFPHHENEIAQSEAATGKPFVKYWMHCGYLLVDGAKMSKSLGNFYTLRDLLAKGYTGREIRYVLLAAHYRGPLNFTLAALESAKSALKRLDDFSDRLAAIAQASPRELTPTAAALPEWAVAGRARFRAALDEDLGMPEALSALFEMVNKGNRDMDVGHLQPAQASAVLKLLDDLDQVLGCLNKTVAERPTVEIEQLVARREAARGARDWTLADQIRKRLAEMGWELRDTPEGPKLKRK